MNKLFISKDLQLPMQAVTETFAILAKRGMGKTHTGVVIAEELLEAGAQIVIADPVGVWWGLRTGFDGKKEGFPILIIGGDHGDLPLDPAAGTIIADMVVDERVSVILDMSRLSKSMTTRFMADFAERLYQRNRSPLHLILDEADAFAPQKPQSGQERMLGAIDDIVRRGRTRGLGVTLITQRSAVINKDVLTQAEVLICLRLIAPQDRAAVDAWVQAHGTTSQRKDFMDSLASLPVGTAWIWSPGWLEIFQKVKIRQRGTFDSSVTPKFGQKSTKAVTMAEIDLDKARITLASVVEAAKQNDPQELKAEIKRLQKLVADTKGKVPVPECIEVEIPMLGDEDREALFRIETNLIELKSDLDFFAASITAINRNLLERAKPAPEERSPAPVKKPVPASKEPRSGNATELNKAQANILRSFYWLRDEERTPSKVAYFAGYKNGGHFNNTLGSLRSMGLVKGWEITPEGFDEIPTDVEEKPTGAELREWIRPKINAAENKILDVLYSWEGNRIGSSELARLAGYNVGGHFNNTLGHLRSLDLAEGYDRDGGTRASSMFFE